MGPYSGQELDKALRKRKAKIMYCEEVDEVTGLGRVGLSSRKKTPMGKLRWDLVYGEEKGRG